MPRAVGTIAPVFRQRGINFNLPRIAAACRKAGVARLFLFGSILTDRFRQGSDVEMRVDTDPVHPADLLALG